MAIPLLLLLLLAMFSGSDGAFCVCKPGSDPTAMQKAIDYACSKGADCTQIAQNGPCYSPVSVVAHCSYATNSYFQKNAGMGATCDFAGVATLTGTDPSAGMCKYPAGASGAGTGMGTGGGTGGGGMGTGGGGGGGGMGTGGGGGMGTGGGGGGGGMGTGAGTGGMGTGTGTTPGAGTGMGTGTGLAPPGSTAMPGTAGGLSPPFGGAYGPSGMSPDFNEAAAQLGVGGRVAGLLLGAIALLFV